MIPGSLWFHVLSGNIFRMFAQLTLSNVEHNSNSNSRGVHQVHRQYNKARQYSTSALSHRSATRPRLRNWFGTNCNTNIVCAVLCVVCIRRTNCVLLRMDVRTQLTECYAADHTACPMRNWKNPTQKQLRAIPRTGISIRIAREAST